MVCSFSCSTATTAVCFVSFRDVSATVSRPRVRTIRRRVSTIDPDAVSRSITIISWTYSVSRVYPVISVADRATTATLSNEQRSTTCRRVLQPHKKTNDMNKNTLHINKKAARLPPPPVHKKTNYAMKTQPLIKRLWSLTFRTTFWSFRNRCRTGRLRNIVPRNSWSRQCRRRFRSRYASRRRR